MTALDARVNDGGEVVFYEDYPWGGVVSLSVFNALGHSPDFPYPDRVLAALEADKQPPEEPQS
jgi:hypothetical protein